MCRSKAGLAGAGEWPQLQALWPDLHEKAVLDLGCGYGWHCIYAAQQGARQVVGLDSSSKMIKVAQEQNSHVKISYLLCDLEKYHYPSRAYDLVIANLVLHYVADLDSIYKKIRQTLRPGGVFLCNIEHPVFTSGVGQDWIYDAQGQPDHWPVDDYFRPGPRLTRFLGQDVRKYHHTLTQILDGLLQNGFILEAVQEALPPARMLQIPALQDELRRPMMLLVRVKKPDDLAPDQSEQMRNYAARLLCQTNRRY